MNFRMKLQFLFLVVCQSCAAADNEPEVFESHLNATVVAVSVNINDLVGATLQKWIEMRSAPATVSLAVFFSASAFLSGATWLLTFVVWGVLLLTWKFQNQVRRLFVSVSACKVVSLGVAFRMASVQFTPVQYDLEERIKGKDCEAEVIIFCYAIIATFAWVTVVNFTFWRGLGSLSISNQATQQPRKWTYVKYSAFGWGSPVLILGLMWFLDEQVQISKSITAQLFSSSPGREYICKGRDGQILLFTLPVCTAFMVAIVTLAILTLKSIQKQQDEARVAQESRNRSSISNFQLFWKLNALMGLEWAVEVPLQILLRLIEWATVQNRLGRDVGVTLYLSGSFLFLLMGFIAAACFFHLFIWSKKELIIQQLRQLFTCQCGFQYSC